MERRGQARDNMLGIQSSMSYSIPPPTSQESPVKLPLAPLVATSADRRGNAAAVPTRRGSSIFSPTQILDNQNHPPPHLRHQGSTPPQLGQNEPNPDPDPAPTAAATAAGSSNPKAQAPAQPRVSPPPPPPPPPAAIAEAGAANCSNTSTSSIIFRECLKNHAAGIGGHIVDGCGEFMASGEEGTPEAMRCAACDCHRNFHRKEVEGEPPPQQPYLYYPYNPNSGTTTIHRPNPLLHHLNSTPRGHHQNHHKQPTMVNFGGNPGGGAAAESSSEDLNMFHSGSGGHASMQPSISGSKKRSRTKFSQEQKDRMHEFAEKLDWRIQKQDDSQIQQFCTEVGVKRQGFKVWMHNNKQAMKKKQI
ncbi:zinc-finger homeodomain protein 6-like [Henckelia pumila]|uniref:zinc-finger homeodomain protein 6-like n=1 Tax=Henckelia pumila TaxID=405737 RepID=UPI003C6E5AFB